MLGVIWLLDSWPGVELDRRKYSKGIQMMLCYTCTFRLMWEDVSVFGNCNGVYATRALDQ